MTSNVGSTMLFFHVNIINIEIVKYHGIAVSFVSTQVIDLLNLFDTSHTFDGNNQKFLNRTR